MITTDVVLCIFSRTQHAKILHYVEAVVPRYTDESFKSHFRVSRTLCEEILILFARPVCNQTDLPPEHQVLLSLWIIGNLDSFREVADQFGVTKSTAWEVFMGFCSMCASRVSEFVTWPDDLAKTKAEFENMAGFPGVVGCVDGSYIPIPVPRDHGQRYINRKGFASMNLLAVCDSSLKFTFVNVGWPGSVHDARVYRNTLQPVLEENEQALLSGGHLLGDAAFPVATYLQPPFRDNGHLTPQQSRYNKKLSSTRMSIERAFGRLKCKFRRLQKLDMARVDLMTNVITTACVLHNLSINEETMEMEEPELENDVAANNDDGEEIADLADGDAKRRRIMLQIAG